jgi:hypothetical protein
MIVLLLVRPFAERVRSRMAHRCPGQCDTGEEKIFRGGRRIGRVTLHYVSPRFPSSGLCGLFGGLRPSS